MSIKQMTHIALCSEKLWTTQNKCKQIHKCPEMDIPYSTGNHTLEIESLILLIKNHLMKDKYLQTIFQPTNSWITSNTDTKPYMVEELKL